MCIRDSGPARRPSDAHADDPAGVLQLLHPGADDCGIGVTDPRHEFVEGQRPEHPHDIGEVFDVAGRPTGRQPLQLRLGAGDGLRIQQVTQGQAFRPAEQLGQQGRVEGCLLYTSRCE